MNYIIDQWVPVHSQTGSGTIRVTPERVNQKHIGYHSDHGIIPGSLSKKHSASVTPAIAGFSDTLLVNDTDRSIRGLPLDEQPVKITLEYDGAAYCGWQRQPEVRTVQGDLEQALATVLRTAVTVYGQGRTDSGVHAESQVAHMFLADPSIDLDDLCRHLNGIMSPTCTVRKMVIAPPGFHARFSAIGRRYRYQIIREYSPLRRLTHWFVVGDLDLDVVERGMEACVGEHDFGMFCSHSQEREHTRCTVSSFSMDRDKACLTFRIAANRFLHNMVRRLAGEMVVLGRGKRSLDDFMARLDEPGPAEAGLTAPPHALFLEQVIYPDMAAGDTSL